MLRLSRRPTASLPPDLGLALPAPAPHPPSLGLGRALFWPTGHRERPERPQPALPLGLLSGLTIQMHPGPKPS